MKKILKWLILFCLFLALFLEFMPNGVEMHFAAAPEENIPYHVTMAPYFSLLPFGYANFSPLLTAILTGILAILSVFGTIRDSQRLSFIMLIISVIAVVFALFAMLFSYMTIIGIFIFILLTACAVMIFFARRIPS